MGDDVTSQKRCSSTNLSPFREMLYRLNGDAAPKRRWMVNLQISKADLVASPESHEEMMVGKAES